MVPGVSGHRNRERSSLEARVANPTSLGQVNAKISKSTAVTYHQMGNDWLQRPEVSILLSELGVKAHYSACA